MAESKGPNRLAAGKLADAHEALETGGTVMGLIDVWQGALEHMKP